MSSSLSLSLSPVKFTLDDGYGLSAAASSPVSVRHRTSVLNFIPYHGPLHSIKNLQNRASSLHLRSFPLRFQTGSSDARRLSFASKGVAVETSISRQIPEATQSKVPKAIKAPKTALL